MQRPDTHRQRQIAPRASLGFTLIEAMIVLVILAILAAVAWPSYIESVQKSRRAAAMSAIAKVMQAQERARSNRATYVQDITSALLTGAPSTSEGNHYSLAIATDTATATGYTVVATANTSQAGDSRCATLSAAVNNGTIVYSSTDSSGAAPTGADPCWVK